MKVVCQRGSRCLMDAVGRQVEVLGFDGLPPSGCLLSGMSISMVPLYSLEDM
jgi:hypothetical protein